MGITDTQPVHDPPIGRVDHHLGRGRKASTMSRMIGSSSSPMSAKIPAAVFGQLVVGDQVGALLLVGPSLPADCFARLKYNCRSAGLQLGARLCWWATSLCSPVSPISNRRSGLRRAADSCHGLAQGTVQFVAFKGFRERRHALKAIGNSCRAVAGCKHEGNMTLT